MAAIIIWGPGGSKGCLRAQETHLTDFAGGPALVPKPALRAHPSVWLQWAELLPEVPGQV